MYDFEYRVSDIDKLRSNSSVTQGLCVPADFEPENDRVSSTVENKEQAQSLANFLWNEGCRHGDDIREIIKDLRLLEDKWQVKPIRLRRFVKP